jgi:SAM-dependent methyltransferase
MSISNSVSDLYRLNRDILASIRLNFQHYIWKESLGYLLHPSIKLSSPTISIADIGTGTGYVSLPASQYLLKLAHKLIDPTMCSIWLTDPCRQYPNAQLHGFDISDDQYPASGFLESNVSLRYLDILKEIPAEYVEKYDVVHARLLVQVVNQAGGDPVPVIRNLMKLVSKCKTFLSNYLFSLGYEYEY